MINKLCRYLVKVGAVERPRKGFFNPAPVEFYRVEYGDNYFYNAPNYFYTGVLVCFDYNAEAGPEYFRSLQATEDKIRKYARRYGYDIFSCQIHPWQRSFVIATRADREKSADFFRFRDEAIEAVNQAIHAGYVNKTPLTEDDIRSIMDQYGNQYNAFLQEAAA